MNKPAKSNLALAMTEAITFMVEDFDQDRLLTEQRIEQANARLAQSLARLGRTLETFKSTVAELKSHSRTRRLVADLQLEGII